MARWTCLPSPLALVFVLLASFTTACKGGSGVADLGPGDEPEPPGAVPSPPDDGDGPPLGSTLGRSKGGGSSSSGSSSGSTNGKPSNPGTGGYGFVALQTVSGEGTSVVAGFFNAPDPGDGLGSDGCRVDAHPDPSSAPAIGVSAGDISITVGASAARLWFNPTAGGYAEVPWPEIDPIAPDATIVVSAIGATVPAFIGPIDSVSEPAITTNAADGINDAPFDVAWSPIANATKITVKLDGADKTVTCSVSAAASHLVVPETRVAEVIAHPAAFSGCASCLALTVTGSSTISIPAGTYTIALRHESSSSLALAVH